MRRYSFFLVLRGVVAEIGVGDDDDVVADDETLLEGCCQMTDGLSGSCLGNNRKQQRRGYSK